MQEVYNLHDTESLNSVVTKQDLQILTHHQRTLDALLFLDKCSPSTQPRVETLGHSNRRTSKE